MNESRHIQYIKTVSTNGSCQLSLGLESTHKHETTHCMLRLCLAKILSAHILQRGKGLVDKGENGRGRICVTTVSEP